MDGSAGRAVQAPLCAAFDGGPGTCAHARESAAAFLAALSAGTPASDDGAADKVLLVVSELVTNAVRHAPGPVVLTLSASPAGVRIAVRDTSTALPVPRTPDLVSGSGGFGWPAIIRRLATRIDVVTHPGGKEIHATMPW
ncbi:ATP-binding protein [Kitasatospora sp. NPDC002040]|uniref:ATP-binding protein n=1 Tax=Kitasatospora sp. NPDC002040 TaxID=3154661 RepID=UPI0033282D7C